MISLCSFTELATAGVSPQNIQQACSLVQSHEAALSPVTQFMANFEQYSAAPYIPIKKREEKWKLRQELQISLRLFCG